MPKNISTPRQEMRPGLPFIRKRLAESGAGLAHLALDPSLAPEILRVAACLRRALARGNKVLIFGNGGSAAQAQHLAAELVNRFHRERKALAALALTTDSSCLTSIANDWDFRRVFSRQLEALGRPGDVAFAISTSGKSPNILAALKTARKLGLRRVALLGPGGGPARKLVEEAIRVPSPSVPRIQETHLVIAHLLAEILENELTAPKRRARNSRT